MKGSVLRVLAVCLVSLAVLSVSITPVAAGEAYSPFSPVIIEVSPDMQLFVADRLPQYLKNWTKAKLQYSATPYDKYFNLMSKMGQWASTYYDYPAYGTDREGITFTVKVPNRGVEFSITLSEYRWENGTIYHCHNGTKDVITSQELENLKIAWANKIVESAEYLTRKTAAFRDGVIAIHEKELRKLNGDILAETDTLESRLAEIRSPVPADQLMLIPPKTSLKHYIPVRAIIKPMGDIMGMSLVDSGVVFYHPLALLIDYLELDDVVTHELLHRNIHMQGLLLNMLFDPEIWTSFVERNNGGFTFMFHPYQKFVREIARVITSFDAEGARIEMVPAMLGNTYFMADKNIENWNDYLNAGEEIRNTFRKTMFDRFIYEFYAKLIFWSSVNDEMYDKNGAVKTYLYSQYDFTLLGGSEPTSAAAAKKTLEWLNKNESVIKEAYEKAKKELAKEKEKDKQKQKESSRSLSVNVPASVLSIAKQCAPVLGIPYVNDEQVVRDIRAMIELGVISLPQVHIMHLLINGGS